jgi:hypothetical protein
MSTDIYKIKYIKYKKKYDELKKLMSTKKDIADKIIILPKEYKVLNLEQKMLFELYEKNNSNESLSYIKKKYLNDLEINSNYILENESSSEQIENILEKKVITPDEYFLLNDSDKSKYEIYESDYNKFPKRVVPKNYIKINQHNIL